MRTVFRGLMAVVLAAFASLPLASAQGGPPPEVRAAVSATMAMLRAEDDASISAFVRDSMAPTDTAGLTDRLRAARAAAQRAQADGVEIEGAPGGVIINLAGTGGQTRIGVDIAPGGKVTDVRLLNGAGGGGAGNARAHLRAIENLSTMSVDAGARLFEREHFSSAFMARTSAAERRTLIERARNAVAGAAAITVSRENDAVALNLRGAQNVDVVITTDTAQPDRLASFEIRDAAAPSATVLRAEDLPRAFDALAAQGLSGAVHIQRDGQTLLHRAYGIANPEFNVANTTDTVFGIGSTPIDFTVAAILLLDQRGSIDLDDRISRHFPNVPRDKRAITIRQLMTGRSGLADFMHTDADWNPDLAWVDRLEMERRILSSQLRFTPGEGQAHSHGAFGLLAALIERVTGQTYHQFLRENFFDPAGMTRTGLYGETRGLAVRDFAVGPGPSIVGVPNIPPNWGPTSWLVMGSGGMYSTLEDMLRFFTYVRSGQVLQGEHLERYRRAEVGVGGSDQGFYLLHATDGGGSTVMMLLNMEGRSPEVRQLTESLIAFVRAN